MNFFLSSIHDEVDSNKIHKVKRNLVENFKDEFLQVKVVSV